MPSSPVVSVLTPVYNGASFIAKCIQSVLDQSYTDWEYVIHDNLSTDGTADIVRRYAELDSRVRLVRAPDFSSIWCNHNRALRAMSPESRYCKFVHADDLLYPECLSRMVAVAEAHPSVSLVSSYRLIEKALSGGGVFEPEQPCLPGREVIRRFFMEQVEVFGSPSAVLIRADLVRKTERFYDEDFWHADTDASMRVLLEADCGFVPQVLTFTHLHPAAQTSRSFRINTYISGEGRILLRYGPKVLRAREYRRLERRFLSRYGWFLAKQTLRPWRYADTDYQEFHRGEIKQMLAEAPGFEAKASLRAFRHLLRGARANTSPPNGVRPT